MSYVATIHTSTFQLIANKVCGNDFRLHNIHLLNKYPTNSNSNDIKYPKNELATITIQLINKWITMKTQKPLNNDIVIIFKLV